jgi:alpha-1,2-mannosyltransferase
MVPLLARVVAGLTGIPLGLMVLMALYVLMLRRAALERTGPALGTFGIAQA